MKSFNPQIAVIGLGSFGMSLVKSLAKEGAQVIAVDNRIELIDEIKNSTHNAICFDATDVRQLKIHGITEVDIAVVAIGESFDASLIVSMELLNAGVKEVHSRARSDIQEMILRRIGVTEIINPEKHLGERMGVSLHRKGLKDLLEIGEGLSIYEINVPKSMSGFTLMELDLRNRFGINVLSVNRPILGEDDSDEDVVYKSLGFADPKTKLLDGDKMIVLGGKEESARIVSLD